MNNIIAIVQARMGSTRLPGKVLIDINGKSVLNHVIDRLRQSKYINNIIIATTDLSKDDLIEEESKKINCKCYRGSEENVLSRYYEVATLYNGDIIIRITSDCPLIDPKVIDEMIEFYMSNNYEIISNSPYEIEKRTYPRGLDVEIFSYKLLKYSKEHAIKNYELEHVTPYMYENSLNKYYYSCQNNYSKYRLTLDTKEDLQLIREIYDRLYILNNNFYLEEIINLIEKNPHLLLINNNIQQKEIKW